MLSNLIRPFFTLALALTASVGAWTQSEITLDGVKTQVYFNDGDTFKILDGAFKNSRVRITGFNALESYGPVHEWMQSSLAYLFDISQAATEMAQQGSWHCTLEAGRDTYGRLLAQCDDLAKALIGSGLAHAYSMDEKPAKKTYLTQQRKAQKKTAGMWKYGIPARIITSLHSASEGAQQTYDRAISTSDGHSDKILHHENYLPCQKVCIDAGSSCMVFVPFNLRYGPNKSECLFLEGQE